MKQSPRARAPALLCRPACKRGARLGPASTVQKAPHSLDSKDILDHCKDAYFFPDPALSTADSEEGCMTVTPIGFTPNGVKPGNDYAYLIPCLLRRGPIEAPHRARGRGRPRYISAVI